MSSNKAFGEWIVARRKEAGFSASYLFAKRIGLDKTYVGRIEKGERPPSPAFCTAAAEALGFTSDYVLEMAGLPAGSPQIEKEDYTDVQETHTILKAFPDSESKRRAVRLTNNLLRQLAQDAREDAGQAERSADDSQGKTARRNATA